MNRFSKWILFGAGAVALGVVLISAACGSSSRSSRVTQLRVVHLAPTEPSLDLLIDNKVVFGSVAYGVPTAFSNVTSINHDLKLDLAGGTQNVLENPAEPFAPNTSYTYLIIDAPGVQANKLTDDHTVADKGMFKLRVVNGSPNSGPVDVYILDPANPAYATAKPTIGGLASNAASAYQALASGSYQVFMTPLGDNSCLTQLPAPPAPPIPTACLINLNGLNNTAVPAFQAGQNRTLIMLNQIPGGGTYTTLPMLADLN